MITNISDNVKNACERGNAVHIVKILNHESQAEYNYQIDNFKCSRYSNSEKNISIGTACSAQIEFEINGITPDLLSIYIDVLIGVYIQETEDFEFINYGTFKVYEQTFHSGITKFLAYDRMADLEKEYVSTLPFPTTDRAMINEISVISGLDYTLPNNFTEHTIKTFEKKYTLRETLAFLASLQSCNVVVDERNKIKFVFADNTDYVVTDDRIYQDQIIHEEREEYSIDYLSVETVVDNEETTFVSGDRTSLTGIEIRNPYILSNQVVNEMFSKIENTPSIVPCSIEMLGDIRIQVGDVVTVNSQGKEFDVIVMHVVQSIDGGCITKFECFANSEAYQSINLVDPVTRALKRQQSNLLDAKKEIANTNQNFFNYEEVAKNMTSLISQGFGMYSTAKMQEDGSTINYLHDAPNLDDSSVIWQLTSTGLLVSKDGGISWGVDSNGNALANVLTAKGIQAEWLQIAQSNTENYVDNGVAKEVSNLSADLSGFRSEVSSTYVDNTTYNKEIEDLQKQIDGAIETYSGGYEPTLSNEPANAWTTTAEKDKHIGDLFLVNNDGGDKKGFYYRFEKDDTEYKWVHIPDNDVQKALKDAEEANKKAETAQSKADAVGNDLANNYSTTKQMNSAISQRASNITLEVDGIIESTIADNLLPYPYDWNTYTAGGVTVTVNSDGTLSTSGTLDRESSLNFFPRRYKNISEIGKVGDTLHLDDGGLLRTDAYLMIIFYDANKTTISNMATYHKKYKTAQIPEGTVYYNFALVLRKYVNADGLIFKPMLENGSISHTYQPYTESTKAKLELKVDKDNLISEINASADKINLESDELIIKSKDFSLVKGVAEMVGGKIGGWSIQDKKLVSSINGWGGITEADLNRVSAYISGAGTLTSRQIDYYDLNLDGKVDVNDYALIRNCFIKGNYPSSEYLAQDKVKKCTISIIIDPINYEGIVTINTTREYYGFGDYTQVIGLQKTELKTIVGESLFSGHDIRANSDIISDYEGNRYSLNSIGQTIEQMSKVIDIPDKTVPCGNASVIGINSIDLQVGTYQIIGSAVFPANANGNRGICLSPTAALSLNSWGTNGATKVRASDGGTTILAVNMFVKITTPLKLYLNEFQNSGSNLSVIGRIRAIKLA